MSPDASISYVFITDGFLFLLRLTGTKKRVTVPLTSKVSASAYIQSLSLSHALFLAMLCVCVYVESKSHLVAPMSRCSPGRHRADKLFSRSSFASFISTKREHCQHSETEHVKVAAFAIYPKNEINSFYKEGRKVRIRRCRSRAAMLLGDFIDHYAAQMWCCVYYFGTFRT